MSESHEQGHFQDLRGLFYVGILKVKRPSPARPVPGSDLTAPQNEADWALADPCLR
jgi:hypothetical protein